MSHDPDDPAFSTPGLTAVINALRGSKSGMMMNLLTSNLMQMLDARPAQREAFNHPAPVFQYGENGDVRWMGVDAPRRFKGTEAMHVDSGYPEAAARVAHRHHPITKEMMDAVEFNIHLFRASKTWGGV